MWVGWRRLPDANTASADDGERPGELRAVVAECGRHDVAFGPAREAIETDEYDTQVGRVIAVDEFAEVFVFRQE